MSSIGPKPVSLRLDLVAYESLRQLFLSRDGWRCQSCSAMANLEVHQEEFRSHSGHDSAGNLITLCFTCHARTSKLRSVRATKNPSTPLRIEEESFGGQFRLNRKGGNTRSTPPSKLLRALLAVLVGPEFLRWVPRGTARSV
jgi:hypothetical protein